MCCFPSALGTPVGGEKQQINRATVRLRFLTLVARNRLTRMVPADANRKLKFNAEVADHGPAPGGGRRQLDGPVGGLWEYDLHVPADASCRVVLRASFPGERLQLLRGRGGGPSCLSHEPQPGYQEDNLPFRLPCTDLSETPPVPLKTRAKR
jgi:hypothetical protein